jgi:hypothetical protein
MEPSWTGDGRSLGARRRTDPVDDETEQARRDFPISQAGISGRRLNCQSARFWYRFVGLTVPATTARVQTGREASNPLARTTYKALGTKGVPFISGPNRCPYRLQPHAFRASTAWRPWLPQIFLEPPSPLVARIAGRRSPPPPATPCKEWASSPSWR